MRFLTLCTLALLFYVSNHLEAQTSRKVLFLGNSYTAFNNLPQMIKDVALSTGDTLVYDAHTPGGYQLIDHALNTTSQNKIAAGGWDYVALQGQSQEPIILNSQFTNGGYQLNDRIIQDNFCAVPILFMTWGRKNGDASNCASYPEMCTYSKMDSALKYKYLKLATQLNTEVSPISVVWNYLRQNHPNIDLYQADGSHPSLEGSYAAACCFYTTLFKKNPLSITYNSSLNATTAAIIKNAVKTKVYDSLSIWDYKQPARAEFQYRIGPGNNEVIFYALDKGVIQNYHWDFGDGDTSNFQYVTHSYASNGTYNIRLTTQNCDLQGLHTSTLDTTIQFCSHTPMITTSNPWICKHDTLWTQPADSYQWYTGGIPLPETNQFLPDYQKYSSRNFSVLATVSGCSELSSQFSANPQFSGYYFDATRGGSPCNGDTTIFEVLHISGSLSGSESIYWYKDGSLLPSSTNTDTLLITNPGNYLCKVVDANSNCPKDTTKALMVFNCGSVGLEENNKSEFITVYPNPVSETLTVNLTNFSPKRQEAIEVYNIQGQLVKSLKINDISRINVSEMPDGVFFIRLKGTSDVAQKFIKRSW